MSIDEKLALLKYSKMELRHLLNEDKYLEIDFIADELGVNKKDVLEAIKNIVSEKGNQKHCFRKRQTKIQWYHRNREEKSYLLSLQEPVLHQRRRGGGTNSININANRVGAIRIYACGDSREMNTL